MVPVILGLFPMFDEGNIYLLTFTSARRLSGSASGVEASPLARTRRLALVDASVTVELRASLALMGFPTVSRAAQPPACCLPCASDLTPHCLARRPGSLGVQ